MPHAWLVKSGLQISPEHEQHYCLPRGACLHSPDNVIPALYQPASGESSNSSILGLDYECRLPQGGRLFPRSPEMIRCKTIQLFLMQQPEMTSTLLLLLRTGQCCFSDCRRAFDSSQHS